MQHPISLSELTGLQILGTRHSAKKIRRLVSENLKNEGVAVIDFRSVTLTQSFADELIGPLLLEQGPAVLQKLAFKSCSDDARAVITFVVGQRLRDFHDGSRSSQCASDNGLTLA
jgi:hypothetical protein